MGLFLALNKRFLYHHLGSLTRLVRDDKSWGSFNFILSSIEASTTANPILASRMQTIAHAGFLFIQPLTFT